MRPSKPSPNVTPIRPDQELRPEIHEPGDLPCLPIQAWRDLEDVRRKRALIGIPGRVVMVVHDSPGRPAEWTINIAETPVKKGRADG